ncbi:MAG: 1-(5-phosphoribosyl)-5-[(5-phosphoribosylamino)methylideneamino] imidazole-4-carboxamide isomerase [Steroidobacteraceae bacterium]|nr:1-(5-phosphoribosyl)-5-[(5-phosphoribosylamino)methylideneamino] imidazole-4-carboxamide isomerase [Steroidobacteraceae bacterium]
MLLIPSIDLRGGRCVRLHQGNFDAETHYEVSPAELLERYASCGAHWLHIVDLDGARDGRLAHRDTILALASRKLLKLQVGGGVRSQAIVEDLLQNGVARIVVGSAAIEQPAEVREWLRRFGPERICLALDVRVDADDTPRVQTRGWVRASPVSLWDAVADYATHGLKHVLCTDVARDGALAGPNLALYGEAGRRFPGIAWQASGGVRDVADLASLAGLGLSAAVSGRALLEHRLTQAELQPFFPAA